MHLGKYIADPKGYCNLAHHAALGIYPAAHAKMINAGRSAAMAQAKAPYGDVPYADPGYLDADGNQASKSGKPGVKRYPLTADKVMAAWSYINQGKNASQYTPEQLSGIKGKIKSAMKQHGHMVGDSDSNGGRSVLADEEVRELRITSQYKDLDSRLELRTDGAGGQWIGGYASVFMPRESRNLGGFIERVAPSAFNEAKLASWPDVVCRFNHDSNYVLGTAVAGTLQLRTDNIGLDYQVMPPQAEERIRELVQRGDIRYSSFAFRVRPGGDEWGVTDQNFPMRTLHDVDLIDVAPVLQPAYPDSSAAVRATAPALRSLAAWAQVAVDEVRALAEADELRRLFVRTDKPIYRPEPKKLFGPAAAALLLARRTDPYDDEG